MAKILSRIVRWGGWLLVCVVCLTPVLPAQSAVNEAPGLLEIQPNFSPNNLDTPVTIHGSGFVTGSPEVKFLLGNTPLQAVQVESETSAQAVVPWGLGPGRYDLRVINPDGSQAVLSQVYTISQALGSWTTDGPYGGQVYDLAVNPANSDQVLIAVWSSGIFKSSDGGSHWQMIFSDQAIRGVSFGAGSPPAAYFWGGQGLYRSLDAGQNWSKLYQGGAKAFAEDAQNPQRLWAATMDGDIVTTADGGVQWEKRWDGKTSPPVNRVAVDPSASNVVYAGLQNGRLYKSSTSGASWEEKSAGLPPAAENYPVHILSINPYNPQRLLLNHWQEGDSHPAFLSSNGGESWNAVALNSDSPQPNDMLSDVAYVDANTLYAALMANHLWAKSTDGGVSWQAYSKRDCDFTLSIGLDSAAHQPRYLGGGASGVMRSTNGGADWELASYGITALPIVDIAASQADLATVFVAGEHAGAFVSHASGASWQRQTMGFCGSFALGADPIQAHKAFIGSANQVFHNPVQDEVWVSGGLVSPYNGSQDNIMSMAVAVSPHNPAEVWAGGRVALMNNPSHSIGVLFRSANSGTDWSAVNLPANPGFVRAIAFHPSDPEQVWVALGSSRGSGASSLTDGLFRTNNNGSTWQRMAPAGISAVSILFDPLQPQVVYYGGSLLSNHDQGTVYKSSDGGASWSDTGLGSLLSWGWPDRLVMDAFQRNVIYVGSEHGLFRSNNYGANWSAASGDLGQVIITGLASVKGDERSILYVSTIGGFPTASAPDSFASASSQYVRGGVYQYTSVYNKKVYLPVIRK